MPVSFDFVRTIPGRSPESAYRAIVNWLQDEKAKVKEATPPSRIVAAHGHPLQPMGWKRDARKTLVFDLAPAGLDVRVSVTIIPATLNASDVASRPEEARANWSELLAELWKRLGLTETPLEAVRALGIDWSASLRRGRLMTTVGVGFLILGVVVFVISVRIDLGLASIGPIVAGVLSLFYGGLIVRSAKMRLESEQPRLPS